MFGILSAIGGVLGAASANRAASAQTAAANRQVDLQERIYDEQRDLFAPFLGSGQLAQNALMYEMGLGSAPMIGGAAPQVETFTFTPPGSAQADNYAPSGRDGAFGGAPAAQAAQTRYRVGGNEFATMDEAQAFASANPTGGTQYQGFTGSPDYQWRLDQGVQALDRTAAARGGLFSGAAMQASQQFGQRLAAQDRDNYLNRLTGLAGSGQNAAGMQGAAAQNFASGTSNALANIGNAQAAGAVGVGNALQGGLNNAAGWMAYQQAQSRTPNTFSPFGARS